MSPIREHTQASQTQFRAGFFKISPAGAGINAPSGAVFLLLKSSHICSMVTHSTPSCELIYSMILWMSVTTTYDSKGGWEGYLSCMRRTCGRPDTSGWMVIGKMNSSYSR